MRIQQPSKTALAALTAVGLFLPFGAVLPALAGAAPSSSSAAELRECLRASADMHQTTFGGRYVTAEDVARCMEAFRPGSSGGASRGGNASPPTSPSQGGGSATGLPDRFSIRTDSTVGDCRVTGDSVTCTEKWDPLPEYVQSWTWEFAGTKSGLTITGTKTGRGENIAECQFTYESSAPVTYSFNLDGTVVIQTGPTNMNVRDCDGSSNTSVEEATTLNGTWTPIL